jgi:hypothetical protein
MSLHQIGTNSALTEIYPAQYKLLEYALRVVLALALAYTRITGITDFWAVDLQIQHKDA